MKKAIVIGATSGIGKSITEILIQDNYAVGITGRRTELLQSLKEKYPEQICYSQMDVQDLSSIESICNKLVHQLGGMDLLIILVIILSDMRGRMVLLIGRKILMSIVLIIKCG